MEGAVGAIEQIPGGDVGGCQCRLYRTRALNPRSITCFT